MFHVEFQKVVLPHEDIACLVNSWIQWHLGILSDLYTCLKCVFHSKDVPIDELEGRNFLMQKEMEVSVWANLGVDLLHAVL